MEWFATLSLAMGSAWTSGINLYATVTVLGLLQKFSLAKLPGGLDVLDNWWIIGVAGGLYIIEFFADKIPYLDSLWDVAHTFVRIPAGAIVAYAAVSETDPSIYIPAALIGGGLALSSHGTKSALRMGANLSPEPFTNAVLSFVEDVIAFAGILLAVFAPVLFAILLIAFLFFFFWFFPKIYRAIQRTWFAIKGFFSGDALEEVARKAG